MQPMQQLRERNSLLCRRFLCCIDTARDLRIRKHVERDVVDGVCADSARFSAACLVSSRAYVAEALWNFSAMHAVAESDDTGQWIECVDFVVWSKRREI